MQGGEGRRNGGSMDYITAREAAEKWGVSQRRVQLLCGQGRVKGAQRVGNRFLIPADAVHPVLVEKSRKSHVDVDMPLPRKTPFLYMTDLYHTPGTAGRISRSFAENREARVLFEAEIAYSQGNIDKVYRHANYLLAKHSGFYAVLSAGMLLAMCAIWKGDIDMWRRAKVHIAEAPAQTDLDRDVMLLAISAVDIMLYNVESFPDWFTMGCFDPLHKDAYPAAKVYYAKYLYAAGYSVATGAYQVEGFRGMGLMSIIPNIIEPLIAWANTSGTVVSELYLRMTCAAAYHNSGRDDHAMRHLERALELALPDKLFGLLAEYNRVLGHLLEERLLAIDPEAWEAVKRLGKRYDRGWTALSGAVRGRSIVASLTPKQREVAKLAAFGLSNKEIAAKMGMTVSGVKQSLTAVSDKLGVSREDFAAYL